MRALPVVALIVAAAGMSSAYQPKSNITRGIYCHPGGAMSSAVWAPFRTTGKYVTDEKHSGECSIVCDNTNGAIGSGAGVTQRVTLGQTAPRPLKIAGWSKAQGVAGTPGYQYSLYVDLTYTDGESWAMQLAVFKPGTHDWEYAETVIEPKKPLASAAFYAFIREKPGVVWFDDLFFGEPAGANLLKNPGFEKENRVDTAAREKLLAEYADLNANAMHIYLSPNAPLWESPLRKQHYEGESPLAEFLRVMREHDIGVWVTMGDLGQPCKDADDPAFPIYACPNGKWGDNSVAVLSDIARNDIAGVSLTPDEYNYTNYGLKEGFGKHADARVRKFYEDLPGYCDCPRCRERFQQTYGTAMPDLHRVAQTDDWRKYINFRYLTTTDWLRRGAQAVKQANPECRADSLICVTPVCSDRWWSVGVAWDDAGYKSGIDFLTTDPYIELHNYLGDSTHWYVTETAERLTGAHPRRQCGIVLEASRLRPDYRELDPVEVYGSALTAVFHGAKELAWWHHSHITGLSPTAVDARQTYATVKATYQLLKDVDPWLQDLRSVKRVALLHSRASEDWWRFYTEGKPAACLTHAGKDARYASRAQVEVLMHALRKNVPVDLFYLESVTAEQLADYPVVVVPFAFAISDRQVKVLQAVAQAGKAVVVISECGSLTEEGIVRERPALLDLLGLQALPGGEQSGPLTARPPLDAAGHLPAGTVTSYATVTPVAGTQCWALVNEVPVILARSEGKGRIVFLAGEFGAGLPQDYRNERKGRSQRVYPPRLAETPSELLLALYRSLSDGDPVVGLAREVKVEGPAPEFPDDVEVRMAENSAGDLVCLCTNWTGGTATLGLALDTGRYDVAAARGRLIRPDATVTDVGRVPAELGAQEACVLRIPRKR